jgi:hypothetical protein
MLLYDPDDNLVSSIIFNKNHPSIVRRFLPGAASLLLPKVVLFASKKLRLWFAIGRLISLAGMAYYLMNRNVLAVGCYWIAFLLDIFGRGIAEEEQGREEQQEEGERGGEQEKEEERSRGMLMERIRHFNLLGDRLNVGLLFLAVIFAFLSSFSSFSSSSTAMGKGVNPFLFFSLFVPTVTEVAAVTSSSSSSSPSHHQTTTPFSSSATTSSATCSSSDPPPVESSGAVMNWSSNGLNGNRFELFSLFRGKFPGMIAAIGLLSEVFLLVVWQG